MTQAAERLLEEIPPSLVVAFDMDGTLVDSGPRDEVGGPLKLPVRHEVAVWARELRDAGHKLVIVTGRDWRWEERTLQDLERVFEEPAERLSDIILELQEEWEGWRLAVKRKAAALKRHGCHLIIGDQAHLDGGAAAAAGIPFLDVEELIRRRTSHGDPFHGPGSRVPAKALPEALAKHGPPRRKSYAQPRQRASSGRAGHRSSSS